MSLTGEPATPVLYLDLDGTVREGKDDALGRFVNGPKDVRVFPEAVVMMRRWKAGGGRIIGVSNQGGVALGIVSAKDVIAAVIETQRQTGDLFDKITMCMHHPDAQNLELARCWCRKPAPGLLIEGALALAAKTGEIYPPYMALMVGDREEDRLCAERASIDFEDASHWRAQAKLTAEDAEPESEHDHVFVPMQYTQTCWWRPPGGGGRCEHLQESTVHRGTEARRRLSAP